jgi:hypothetical protein
MWILTFVPVVAAAEDPCADPAAAATWAAEVAALYDAGEAERADRTSTATSVLERDEERLDAARKLDAKGRLCTPLAKWQAAWLMVQADDVDVLERAYTLAQESMKGGEKRGPWLTAYTFDTWRVAGGYRQTYGSQTRLDDNNRWCLIEVEPDATDEERKKFGMPPITETYRKILDNAGFTAEAATLERLDRVGLYCKPLAATKKAQRTVRAPD